jgi:hypothetical protein
MKGLRRAIAVSVAVAISFLSVVNAQGTDYVTEEEEDLIRDAQGLALRVPLLLKFLDNRIVALGLRERSAKEREQAKKDMEKYEREVKDAAKVKDAEVRAKPVNPDVYLRKHTRAELLRGFMQITDEIMDNIDDAYDRKLPVREHVEALEKFLDEQLPRLAKLQPTTPAETSAVQAVTTHTEKAIDDCRNALKTLPKTLKTEPTKGEPTNR